MNPFIKWAGGKRKFAEDIANCIGVIEGTYFEPFLGSGALLLYMTPERAVCSDVNKELINLYNVVKRHPTGLIRELKRNFITQHNRDFYYEVRGWDRNDEAYIRRSSIQKAARFMYLNKTCYNGLWRVNSQGYNNVPMGTYVHPAILIEPDIVAAHSYFKEKEISFICQDYKATTKKAKKGDFVYLDPPYDVDEGQSGFIAYSQSLFNRKSQIELKEACDELLSRDVRVGISNSNTSFIRNLYLNDKRYRIARVFSVNRTIGSTVEARRMYSEIFIIGEP